MASQRFDAKTNERISPVTWKWEYYLKGGRGPYSEASDGRVKGYCAISRQRVDFVAETQRIGKNPTAKIFASGQDPDPDEVVRDYLAGDKTIVIQDRYKISPGRMYRVLRSAGVKLRTIPHGQRGLS